MRFEHPDFLWLLLFIPFSLLVYMGYVQWYKKSIQKLGNPKTLQPFIKGYMKRRQTTKFVLLLSAIVLGIFALANPQKPDHTVTIERSGIDIFYVLDVSRSMLATDIAPNRLERAKQTIKRSLDKMKDNRVGLVIFAGGAYLQVPLTVDYNALKMYLDNATPNIVPQQGTVLADAIEMANNSFSRKENKYKAIILFSDGEDHDEQASEVAKKIALTGTVIYTIGVGSPNGTVLIDPTTGQPRTNSEQEPIVTKLNEGVLKNIAHTTQGFYFLLNNINQGADNIIAAINKMEKADLGNTSMKAYKSYFQIVLGLGLLCLLISILLPKASKTKY
jgi:Ca-activated chloride channel family protein